MAQEGFDLVPQAMLDIFTEYGLELPPLPQSALPVLTAVGDELFATDAPPAWILGNTPVFLSFTDLALFPPLPGDADKQDAGADDTVTEDASEEDDSSGAIPYFLCGFSGRGLQDRVFLYLYSSRRLRVGICVPFGCAYADPERERKDIARSMELMLLLLHCTREGLSLDTDGTGTFFWTHDRHGSSFQLINKGGEKVLAGDSADALLDYLEHCRIAAAEENPATRFWVRV